MTPPTRPDLSTLSAAEAPVLDPWNLWRMEGPDRCAELSGRTWGDVLDPALVLLGWDDAASRVSPNVDRGGTIEVTHPRTREHATITPVGRVMSSGLPGVF